MKSPAIVLDTNAYSEMRRGNSDVVEFLGRTRSVLMTVFVLGELEAGFRGGNRYEKNKAELVDFLGIPIVTTVATTQRTAELFGELKDSLRREGFKIPVDDIWIAAVAKEYDAEVLTFDEHFQKMTKYGVKVNKLAMPS